ncbi:MAG TPA: hypothetical protein VIU12_25825 [Chryseolinea sp.]
MFNAISWNSFLYSVGLIVGAYYFISTLLLYYDEIKDWLARRGQRATPTPATSSAVMGDIEASSPIVFRHSTAKIEDLVIGENDEPGEQIGAVGSPETKTSWQEIDKLLDEVRTVLAMVVESSCDRQECASLMTSLFGRYPHLKETSYRESVTLYVLQLSRESLSYELSLQDVLSWWEAR